MFSLRYSPDWVGLEPPNVPNGWAVVGLLKERKYNVPQKTVLLVVCLLNSLIDSHVRELRRLVFTASIASEVKLRLHKQST